MDREDCIHKLKLNLKRELQFLNNLVAQIEKLEIQNDQEIINWLDELNKLSVKF